VSGKKTSDRARVEEVIAARRVPSSLGLVSLLGAAIYLHFWGVAATIGVVVLGFLIYDMRRADTALDRALASAALLLLSPVSIVGFAVLYREVGLIDVGGTTVTSLSDALYFSVVTWTTLGYGDIRPSPDARIWAAAEALYGYVVMAFLIAQILYWLDTGRARGRTPNAPRR
jgi:hypothetical protein